MYTPEQVESEANHLYLLVGMSPSYLMLRAYAATLKAAQGGVTEAMPKWPNGAPKWGYVRVPAIGKELVGRDEAEARIKEAALSAQQQETPCSLDEALAVIKKWADHGGQVHGSAALRLRTLVDCIAPQQQGQEEVRCVICGAEEPYTGTCGSNDPRALCKQATRATQNTPVAEVDWKPRVDGYEVGPTEVRWLTDPPAAGTKLYTDPPAQPAERVPEGWKLVPVEATDDMLKAAYPLHWWDGPGQRLKQDYRKLVDASPAPSEGGKGVDDTFARELYIASQCDVHNLHTLAWSELTEATRDEWRKKANGAAR